MSITHLSAIACASRPLANCIRRLTSPTSRLLCIPPAGKLSTSSNTRGLRLIASARPPARPPPPPRKPGGAPKPQNRGPSRPGRGNLDQRPLQLPRRPSFSSPAMDPASSQASLLHVQNMMALCRQLRLPVSYKVYEWNPNKEETSAAGAASAAPAGTAAGATPPHQPSRRFSVVVHVHGDHAFKKYLQQCSSSDLLLYRGLLLQVEATPDLSRVVAARVQQAFLPKFENEGQDASVADAVTAAAAGGRPTVVTVKHSGSLVTLSYDGGWAAKNSVANEYTAGGAALLRAHYDRRHPNNPAAATAALDRLFATMAARRLCLSFEMVTSSHGHHGQLPAAEYLVTTAAHSADPATAAPAFLGWLPFLELCTELGLPTNDTWVVAGGEMAAAVRQALDGLALRGGPTGHAMRQLGQLISEGAAEGCMHLPGTYPHDEWQGERLEGFVVAAGQELGPQDMQRLSTLRDLLAAARLPLAAVPEHLRRTYQHALREALAAAAAEKGLVVDGDAAAAAAAPSAASDAVRSRLQAAAAAWMPHSAVSYAAAAADVRERLTEALASQAPEGLLGDAPHVVLPEGRGRLYSRLALAKLSAQSLQALLAAEAAAEAAAAGGSSQRALALQEAAAEAAAGGANPTDMLLVRALRALAGRPETAVTLRYKKKMLMWTFPDSAAADAAAADGTAASEGGVVGYSLMTFVIRNGLGALCQGAATYTAYVDNMVRRSWGLPPSQVAQVQHFARCWAAWVAARGGAAAVNSDRYLDTAEPFVTEFLRRRGAMALSGRSETAFQGILICVDTPEPLTQALRRAVAPSLELTAAKLGDTPFTKGMVPGACMLWLPPNSELPKKLRDFMAGGAAPFTWVAAASAPRSQALEGNGGPDAKRQKGLAQAKIAAVMAALGPDGAAKRVRHVTLPLPEDDVDGAASARLAAEAAAWLGPGTTLPPADPAVAAYFVTIPGAGKSALTKGLTLPAGPGQQQQELTVKVLNSDTMKKTVKGFNPNRYWLEVASAADSCRGGNHVVVAVADKNLVPSPPGNIARALEPLKGTGVASLALVPVVAGPSSLTAPSPAHADLYGGLSDLPFPLELVALCMLRTLQRRNHEGGLDGASAPSAATVVAMFAGFYRHKTLPQLLAALRTQFTRVAKLPIMRGDGGGGGSVPADVLRHVALGLRDVSERAKPQLPVAWEARARELLLRPDVVAALEALQLPMEDVRHHIGQELAATVEAVKAAAASAASDGIAGVSAAGAGADGAVGILTSPSLSLAVADLHVDGAAAATMSGADASAAADASVAEERVSYFSVSGIDEEALRAAARGVLAPELHGRIRKGSLHVTLWHRNDPDLGARSDLRCALMELVGSPVELEVTAIDVSPEVIAAEVRLLSADEVITSKPYHHITLVVEKGHTAAASNLLPARLAAGELGVERRPLPGGPLLLSGVVTAVEAEATGAGGGGEKRPPVV